MTETITTEEYHALLAAEASGRNKYGARAVVTDEGRFDSTGEHERWCELKLLRDQGAIRFLQRQTRWPLDVNRERVGEYVADFEYWERCEDDVERFGPWRHVVEDFKGIRTPLYRLKAKLMRACYGITIRETGR